MESKTLTTPKLKELQGPKVRFKQPLLGATMPRNLMSFRSTVTEKSCKTFTHSITHSLSRPKSDQTDFGQKGYHMKGHLKRNRMTQFSAS